MKDDPPLPRAGLRVPCFRYAHSALLPIPLSALLLILFVLSRPVLSLSKGSKDNGHPNRSWFDALTTNS
jgi:hypothetical protein